MKKCWLLIFTMLLFVLPAPAQAAAGVSVTLPDFPISLNGRIIDNAERQYPLVSYRGITYFPMTYNDCRFLGLETRWSDEAGLSIQRSCIAAAYRSAAAAAPPSRTLRAQPVDFAITVNAERIDNHREDYPLLLIDDVTYFPLTWRWAVDAFLWDYSYDESHGLLIRSSNPQVTPLSLADPLADPAVGLCSIALAGNTCYYRGNNGLLWQHDLTSGLEKSVFQYPEDSVYGSFAPGGVSMTPRGLEITYHTGGAAMGTNHRLLLNADGTTTPINHFADEAAVQSADGICAAINQGPFASMNNAVAVQFPGEDWRALNLPDGHYGMLDIVDGYRSSESFAVRDHDLYLIASPNGQVNRICRLNLDTGALTVCSDRPAHQFVIAGKRIYLADATGIYQMPLAGGPSVQIADVPSADNADGAELALAGDQLYYLAASAEHPDDRYLYRYPYGLALPYPCRSITAAGDDLLLCRLENTRDVPYALILLDAQGRILLQTSDQIMAVTVDGDRLAYILSDDGQGYLAEDWQRQE